MAASTALINIAVSLVMAAAEAFQPLPVVCPPGWLAWQHSCYILLLDRMNWFQASEHCDRPGSSMVVPDSWKEQDFIWRNMKGWMKTIGATKKQLQLWIGCINPYNKTTRLVCSGEKGIPVYENWGQNQPNHPTHECIRMNTWFDGQWGDASCKTHSFVACEMRVSRRVYCLPFDDEGRFTPQCLLNHHIKNLTTTGVTACGQACWAEPRCHSFNIWQQAGNTKMCQLNKAARLEADLTDFENVQNCFFFEL